MIIHRIATFVLVLCCLAATGCPKKGPRVRHVFIVSFDQGGSAVIQNSEMPIFKEMAAAGAHTWSAFTIVPSLTLPAHVSMLTGVGVQQHQVTWNDADPEKGFVTTPTILGMARQHGLKTAMFVGKTKFRPLAPAGTVDAFVAPSPSHAKAVAEAFAEQLGTLKPNLCFIHFADADVAGHTYGVESPEKMKALTDCDAALKIVRDAIHAAGFADTSVMILTADHGGHDRTPQENEARAKQGLPPQLGTHGSPAKEDVEIPWIAWGKGVKPHFTITAPVVQYDTAATALWLLGLPIPENFWGRPVTSAFE